MNIQVEEYRVTVYPEGRITSENGEAFLKELMEAARQNPNRELVLDASNLSYLSSAGLRALLVVSKRTGKKLRLCNVSPALYDVFSMTGFDSIFDIRKKMRSLDITGCEIIGRGTIGTVYRIDEDTIVKVYEIEDSLPMIENEERRAKQALLKGIPTAISYDVVKVGEKYGSVFEMVKAVTCNDLILKESDRMEEILKRYTSFLREIHAVEMDPGEVPEAKEIFLGYLEALENTIPPDILEPLRELLRTMPDNRHTVHGDIQMRNVMCTGDDEMLMIDMESLSMGDPVFDLQGIFVTYAAYPEDEPENPRLFLGISPEQADYIWKRVIELYYEGRNEAAVCDVRRKIRIAGYIRFLYLVAVMGIGLEDLREIRIRHTLEHLRELIPQVSTLETGGNL